MEKDKAYKYEIDAPGLNLERTLFCGQAFRWSPCGKNSFFGTVNQGAVVAKTQNNSLLLTCSQEDLEFWKHYFDLAKDYGEAEKMLLNDPKTAPSVEYSSGIRVLNQDPFETMISFIISANNNVKRISSTIERLSKRYGTHKSLEDREYFTFPSAKSLANASEVDLKECGVGYRAPYIISSAAKIANGYDFEAVRKLDYETAKKELMTFSGIGPKVADCILLFSLGFGEAFPVDVWVKRVLVELFDCTQKDSDVRAVVKRYGKWAGAAQQYLFHYARQVGLGTKKQEKSINS